MCHGIFYNLVYLIIHLIGLTAGDSDRTQGIGPSLAVIGSRKSSAESPYLAEQED